MNFVSRSTEVRIVLWFHPRCSYAFQPEISEKKRKEELTYVTNLRNCIKHVFASESSMD